MAGKYGFIHFRPYFIMYERLFYSFKIEEVDEQGLAKQSFFRRQVSPNEVSRIESIPVEFS